MKKLYITSFIFIIGLGIKAQTVTWDFNGNIGSEVAVSPTTIDPNVTSSAVIRGNVVASALSNAYAATNWTQTNSLADAISNNSYYQFSIHPNAGFGVSFLAISANFRRSTTGPRSFQWRYSLNGTNFSNAGSQISYAGTENNGRPQLPVELSAIDSLQNIPSTVTVTFRLYGYNALNAAGSFALGRLTGDDLSILGKIIIPYVPVPVKLISFNAVNNNNVTRLHWLVNCTSSSIKFEIQRAGSNMNFNSIYSSTETQARCAQPFDVNDENTAAGINFYRLKMIDIDGKVSYSNTLQVVNKISLDQKISVYPAIAAEHVNVSIPSEKNYMARIIFIDNTGRQVNKMDVQLYKGINNVSVNISDLAPGKYYINVIKGTEKINTVVLIKH